LVNQQQPGLPNLTLMKTTLLACAVLLLSFCFNLANAQTDTTATDTTQYWYYPEIFAPKDSAFHDLGRVHLEKKFTQAITIKAADLEKLPFMDLGDALTVYYNGMYGAKQKFTYVINGVLNTDVNAYSIFDIEEVTFIQNAATALNGIIPSQVLVLIKTKHGGQGESGISVNGQTNAISRYIPNLASTPKNIENSGRAPVSLYHQYYVSYYTNASWISAGLSGTLQKNVFPQYFNRDHWNLKFQPYTANRYKFNGFVDFKIDTNNIISVNAGYVPQNDLESRKGLVTVLNVPVETGYQRTEKQTLMFANLEYRSTILERITNKFSAGIQRLNLRGSVLGERSESISDTIGAVTNYTIKNNIAYQFALGPLMVMPQLNVLYRVAKDTSSINYNVVLTRIRGYTNTQKIFMVTPSMTVNFKDIAVLQFGAQRAAYANTNFYNNRTIIIKNVTGPNGSFFTDYTQQPSEINNATATPILPFASFSFDFVKAAYSMRPKKKRPKVYSPSTALMLYASFARSTSYTGDFYGALSDNITERFDPVVTIYQEYNADKAYNQLSGGLTYALLNKGLSFSYNYSSSKFVAVNYARGVFGSPPPDTAKLNVADIETHRLSINFSTADNHKFKWTANLNGAFIMSKGPKLNYYTEQMRLFNSQKGILTGGFVNQLSFNSFFAGVNVLYGFNKPTYNLESANNFRFIKYGDNTHVLNLQNAYLGYKFGEAGWFKSLEVFANGSNLWQKYSGSDSNRHYAIDESRYYGGGFKLAM
jgi:hypothetical protein